ncbi:MAG: CPBP family intramembrane metalloprotease [Candidatus Dadabacteria bacterium]|nr:CPBP family intramembrane metalloprotease [Candidatus Dadabacteria bacterium]
MYFYARTDMNSRIMPGYALPLVVYALVIASILAMRLFLPWPYVISISALIMLAVPFFLKPESGDLKWRPRGIIIGLLVSAVLLAGYLAVIWGYGLYSGRALTINKLSYSFILTQLLLVALPEEVFFRGYLQHKFGNSIKSVVIVSALFALGHFVTLCLGGNHSHGVCVQAILTFFPSLVMGYLYLATGTLWASIIFHFLANVVHIAVGLS